MAKTKPSPVTVEIDLERLVADLHSPDDETRAHAVRLICPCRMGWDRFQECMAIVTQLQKDPSPIVRRAALHVWEDAFEIESCGLPTSPQEIRNELVATRRRLRWRPDEDLPPADRNTRRLRTRGKDRN